VGKAVSLLRRVGILTGGGDVPGLNSVIKALVWRLAEEGREVLGIRRGWAGLLGVVPDSGADNSGWLLPLTRQATRAIDRQGGTILHSSRTNPALLPPDRVPAHLGGKKRASAGTGLLDLTEEVLAAIDFLRLDALVAVGGDGTLAFARRLDREGVPVIAVPKTMDNDVWGTDYCIGFSTAVSRSVQLINDLRTAAGSHERFLVVELFGRNSGETCLLASYLAGTDRALLAEVPFDPARVAELLAADKRENPSHYAVVAVSEGAHPQGGRPFERGTPDPVGHRKLGGVGLFLGEELERFSGERAIVQALGYLMRSGPPDSLDQLVANNFGNLAADLLLAGEAGRMVSLQGGCYAAVPVARSGEGTKRVDVDRFYDRQAYRPHLRGILGLPMFLH
jgi:6-phosphofructokinase 1